MELLGSISASEISSGLVTGSASEHWELGVAHIKRALQIRLFGGATQEGAEDTIEKSTLPKNGVFLPTQAWKEYWDLWVLVLIL